jgi:hypothetical protein
MSKIVVGMNNHPAITPQRIDCGLRNTSHIASPALVSQSSRWLAGFDSEYTAVISHATAAVLTALFNRFSPGGRRLAGAAVNRAKHVPRVPSESY